MALIECKDNLAFPVSVEIIYITAFLQVEPLEKLNVPV